MAITVVPKSDTFTVATRPSVNKPVVSGTDMTFTSTRLEINGACQITGVAGDNPAGWTLGIIQCQWIETNWGEYRGETNTDGSAFLQRARAPARPAQACRDTLAVGGILVDNDPGHDRTVAAAKAPFPVAMTARLRDAPNDFYPLTRMNTKTKKLNFLHEVQLEFHFCSVLTLMNPAGAFHHLKSIYWNLHWQATFRPTNFAKISAPWTITLSKGKGANAANLGGVINGDPTDKRFKDILTKATAPNCNAVATHAAAKPNVQERNTWENFDVRR